VGELLMDTVSTQPIVLLRLDPGHHHGELQYRNIEGPIGVPMACPNGAIVFFYLWLHVEALPTQDGEFFIVPHNYIYRLQESSERLAKPFIRWEFAPLSAKHHPHHHLQMQGHLQHANKNSLSLNKLHVPTGRVRLPDVMWFLFAQLHLEARCPEAVWKEKIAQALPRLQTFEMPSGTRAVESV